jgi:hypothetical protein
MFFVEDSIAALACVWLAQYSRLVTTLSQRAQVHDFQKIIGCAIESVTAFFSARLHCATECNYLNLFSSVA